MPRKNAEALKLPDQLLVRYFRQGEIEHVAKVAVGAGKALGKIGVTLRLPAGPRIDHWQDLGGGLGFVPDEAGD